MEPITVITGAAKGLLSEILRKDAMGDAARDLIDKAEGRLIHATSYDDINIAITQLETAASIMKHSGFTSFWGVIDNSSKMQSYNDLCYLVALLNFKMQKDYSLIARWADELIVGKLFVYHCAQWKDLLSDFDYQCLESRSRVEIEQIEPIYGNLDDGFDPTM